VDFLDRKVEVVRMKDAPATPGEFDMILQNAEGEQKQIYFENPEIIANNPIRDELEQFADAIEKDLEPAVPLRAGARALDVALKIIDAFGRGNSL
jgi:predicted dehydrogenase